MSIQILVKENVWTPAIQTVVQYGHQSMEVFYPGGAIQYKWISLDVNIVWDSRTNRTNFQAPRCGARINASSPTILRENPGHITKR